MDILTALVDNKNIFTITRQMTREQLSTMRNTTQFSCPQCENPLRLKIGKVVTPHFAHVVLTDCLTSFSERESPAHLLGKHQLGEFFKRTGCQVSIEAFLPEISQRPDLLVKKESKRFAIEFQCSPIPIDEVRKRNDGYSEVNLSPLWLLRTPTQLRKFSDGITHIKLSKFMQSFIVTYDFSGATLITYDPTSSKFHYFSHLLHLGGTSYLTKIRSLSVDHQTFPFGQVKPLNVDEIDEYWRMFQYKRAKLLQTYLHRNKFGVRDRLLRRCYTLRIRPQALPLFIGMPIYQSQLIKNPLAEWQLMFISELEKHGMDVDELSLEWVDQFIYSFCNTEYFNEARVVIERYAMLLRKINYDWQYSLTHQSISIEKLKSVFKEETVANRCEN